MLDVFDQCGLIVNLQALSRGPKRRYGRMHLPVKVEIHLSPVVSIRSQAGCSSQQESWSLGSIRRAERLKGLELAVCIVGYLLTATLGSGAVDGNRCFQRLGAGSRQIDTCDIGDLVKSS